MVLRFLFKVSLYNCLVNCKVMCALTQLQITFLPVDSFSQIISKICHAHELAVRKSPGMRMIHHDFVISALSAFESMLPHEICSNGRPIPMKPKVDSAMIALLIFMTTINMIDEAKLGVRCFHKHAKSFLPYILLR